MPSATTDPMLTPTPDDPEVERQLLPCPFCGGSSARTRYQDYDRGKRKHGWQMTTVECVTCDIGFDCDTDAQAIAAWNRRTTVNPPIWEDAAPVLLDAPVRGGGE